MVGVDSQVSALLLLRHLPRAYARMHSPRLRVLPTRWQPAPRLLALRTDDLFLLDAADRSLLEVATPACALLVQAALLEHQRTPEPGRPVPGGPSSVMLANVCV